MHWKYVRPQPNSKQHQHQEQPPNECTTEKKKQQHATATAAQTNSRKQQTHYRTLRQAAECNESHIFATHHQPACFCCWFLLVLILARPGMVNRPG